MTSRTAYSASPSVTVERPRSDCTILGVISLAASAGSVVATTWPSEVTSVPAPESAETRCAYSRPIAVATLRTPISASPSASRALTRRNNPDCSETIDSRSFAVGGAMKRGQSLR